MSYAVVEMGLKCVLVSYSEPKSKKKKKKKVICSYILRLAYRP